MSFFISFNETASNSYYICVKWLDENDWKQREISGSIRHSSRCSGICLEGLLKTRIKQLVSMPWFDHRPFQIYAWNVTAWSRVLGKIMSTLQNLHSRKIFKYLYKCSNLLLYFSYNQTSRQAHRIQQEKMLHAAHRNQYKNTDVIYRATWKKSSGSGLENWDKRWQGIRRADHVTPLYPQNLALYFVDKWWSLSVKFACGLRAVECFCYIQQRILILPLTWATLNEL
jgi:hypothetical protein